MEPFEGFRSRPYQSTEGVWTIGYGSTQDTNNRPVTARTPSITKAQACELVKRDLLLATAEIERDVQVPLTDRQELALLDFIYNLGTRAFRTSRLLRKLNAADYAGAAAEFANWVHDRGRTLSLKKRRQAETNMFEKDIQ